MTNRYDHRFYPCIGLCQTDPDGLYCIGCGRPVEQLGEAPGAQTQPAADWYFDFISPFAYLQWRRLRELGGLLPIRPVPLLFAGLLKHWGHKGPAEIAAKRRFTYRHVIWLAQRHGIALNFPPSHPFNPLRALRLAVALDGRAEVIDALFRVIWEDGHDPNDAGVWSELEARLNLNDADALIESAEVKSQLNENCAQAIAAGVFGVPSLIIGDELFWGFDATDMALDYLGDPRHFAAAEYARIDELPTGVQRKGVNA